MKRLIRRAAAALLAGVLLLSGCANGSTPAETAAAKAEGFVPQLDTEAAVQLEVLGYFGNFEALDQVMNDFNQYYPKLTFNYQQVGGSTEEEYMDANPGVDIIMTSSEFLHSDESTLASRCVDLTAAGVDCSDLDEEMLKDAQVDGKQLAIPIGQNIYGLAVNLSLLEKEGLSIPKNRDEFLTTLAALKEKGYTPIQGPRSKVYAELTSGIVYSGLCEGQPLRKALEDGDTAAAQAELMPAIDLVDSLLSQGYTDPAINKQYPEDNYDQAILRFFEGDVPFWVCNTEKISGMKKRESKSEAFQKDPFDYTFIYPPLGEEGQYLYREPWFGMAANVKATHPDYAVEFLRFLATRDESNKMADIKGIPSIAKESTDPAVYTNVLAEDQLKNSLVNHGEVTPAMESGWYSCITGYADSEYATAQDAMEAMQTYLDLCMAELS